MGNKKNKTAFLRSLIYIRYLLPIIFAVLLIAFSFVPALRYSTVEGTNPEISSIELLDNSWYQVREYLFTKSEPEPTQKNFSQIVLVMIIVMSVLFFVGVLSTVAVAIYAIKYINDIEFRKSSSRIWFFTVVPNRIVVVALQALTLPILFFTRIIILLYDKILNVDVLLHVSFPELWVWGTAFFLITTVLSCISAKYEKDLLIDPFKKIEKPIIRVIDRDDDEEDSIPVFKNEDERRNYEARERSKKEQAEQILRFLNRDENKDN